MTKSELIATLADRRGITIRKADEVVNTIFESMAEALGSGDRIEVRGFGTHISHFLNDRSIYFFRPIRVKV